MASDLPFPAHPAYPALAEAETSTVRVETEGAEVSDRFLYDGDSAAEVLSTSRYRVDELRRAGKLIAVQDGGVYKYRRDDLLAYIEGLPAFEPKRSA